MVRLYTYLFAAAAGLLSCASASANKIHISRPKPSSSNIKDFLAKEAVRKASFARATADASGTAPAVNEDSTYITVTTVGSQTFNLIVDTGSSNTWVGAGTAFEAGSTGKDTGNSFSVTYGSGDVSGEEYTDTVTLGGFTVPNQSIGVANSSSGFDGVDGIIGFGPVDLTEDTVSNVDEVPTFLNNLYSQGTIATEVLGVSFAPESGSDTDDDNGELDIGALDSSKYTGTIEYTPLTTESPYSSYWGITVSSIHSGSKTVGKSKAGAIVDTGTTLIYIPESAYNAWLKAAGGTTDEDSGLAKFSNLPTTDFSFVISGVTYTLTPAEYIIPAAQLDNFGLSSGYYAWINNGGSEAADVNFIIGQKFLENFYAVFDTTNSQVGFATRAK